MTGVGQRIQNVGSVLDAAGDAKFGLELLDTNKKGGLPSRLAIKRAHKRKRRPTKTME